MKTELDYLEQGSGDAVFLLHSTAAGNKQWRKLIDELSPHFKVIAPNLIGYGSTPHWTEQRLQTLNDQVALLDVVFQRYEKLSNGSKIKWVYLKNNSLGLDTVAYKGCVFEVIKVDNAIIKYKVVRHFKN